MNLHGIARGAVSAVNPEIPISVRVSTGHTTAANGTRVPTFAAACRVSGQVQSMTFRDIQQVEGLNLQGNRVAIYINGRVDGLVRPSNKGGDLIDIDCGVYAGTWLVAMVLEQWPDWCKVAVTLQNP